MDKYKREWRFNMIKNLINEIKKDVNLKEKYDLVWKVFDEKNWLGGLRQKVQVDLCIHASLRGNHKLWLHISRTYNVQRLGL